MCILIGGLASCGVVFKVFCQRNSRHNRDRRPLPTSLTNGREPINDIAVIASRRVIGLTTHLLFIGRPNWSQIAGAFLAPVIIIGVALCWYQTGICTDKNKLGY